MQNVETLELLLRRPDIDVNSKNDDGKTPLHFACDKGHVETLELLLRCPDIDVNSKDDDGDTPLHLACTERNVEAAKLLLRHSDIDVSIENTDDSTPLNNFCLIVTAKTRSNSIKESDRELLQILLTKIGDFKISDYCDDFEEYSQEIQRIINIHLGLSQDE